jgi:hypothetical protein
MVLSGDEQGGDIPCGGVFEGEDSDEERFSLDPIQSDISQGENK